MKKTRKLKICCTKPISRGNDKQIVLLDWDGKIKRVSDIWRFTFETIRAAFRRSVEQGSNNLMWDKKKK